MRLIFLLSLVVVSEILLGQEPYIPPSPNASAMIKFSNIEVSHYTGVPNISVPFGELPGKNISIPIGLQYHASGIKVQDVAGSAGLGWNLYAGGAITRVVRGLPDGTQAYCANGPAYYWSNINDGCDGERDLFYFNFLGRSGKMFIDGSNNIQTMPYMDLKVTNGLSSPSGWAITDEKGYRYYFGETAASLEDITYYTGNDASGYTAKYTYKSTWYLTRIVSPAGIQVATFSYYNGSDFEYVVYNDVGKVPSGGSLSVTNVNTKIKVKQAKYLNTISTSIASVQFGYLNNRADLPNSWQLNYISFKDQSSVEKRKIYVILEYFLCGLMGEANCRLKLSAIKEGVQSPVLTHSFIYNDNGTLNPFRENIHYDHYGYYNGTAGGSSAVYRLPREGTLINDIYCVYKSVSTTNAKVFSLSEINFHSGGRTVFEYESSTNTKGLRVKSISSYDGLNLIGKSSFTYSAPEGFNTPVYNYTTHDLTVIWSSSSFNDLFDLSGTNVGYSTVTEAFLDGSKIEREFYNFSDYPNTPPTTVTKYKVEPPLGGTISNLGTMDPNGPPFPAATARFWMHGLPKRISVFDSQNNKLKMDEMAFDEGASISTVQNTALHNYKQSGNQAVTYMSGVYYSESRPVYLDTTKSYIYDQNGYTNYVLDKSTYAYHSLHKTFPTSVTRQVGAGPEEKVTYRYPIDVIGTLQTPPTNPDIFAGGIWYLYMWNVIEPVETISWFKDVGSASFKITGAELKAYRKNPVSSRSLLNSVYSLAIDAPVTSLSPEASLISGGTVFSSDSRYRLLSTYNIDDATSTLTSVQSSSGITSNYEWIYNTLPSATIVNLGSVQFRKAFVYNTINGLTQSTDENGQNTFVEYDSNLGRTKLTRDYDTNIVTRYRYSSRNTNEFAVDFSVNGALVTNSSISFSSLITGEPLGITKYIWDFGDGQISEGTSSSISHTYSSSGTFTIKLSKVNPEYGSVISSKAITINPPVAVSISATTLSIDLCSITFYSEFTANASGGCSSKTYAWYNRSLSGGSWQYCGASSTMVYYPGSVGEYEIKCVVTDPCGSAEETVGLFVNKSDPNCQQN